MQERTLKSIHGKEIRAMYEEKREEGHTLLEVIVAAAILSFVFLGLLGALVGNFTLNNHSRDRVMATQAARDVMEQLMSLNVEGLPAQGGLTFDVLSIPDLPNKHIGRIDIADRSGGSGKQYELAVTIEHSGCTGKPAFKVELVSRRAKL